MNTHRNNYSAGEWSPLLYARHDLQGHGAASSRFENMLPAVLGSARGRPGWEFIAAAKFADRHVRLIGFNYSTRTNYQIEAGDLYARFFTEAGPVISGRALDLGAGDPTLSRLHQDLTGDARAAAQLAHVDALAAAGAKWIRLFAYYDTAADLNFAAILDRANQHGLRVLLTLPYGQAGWMQAGATQRPGSTPTEGSPQWNAYRLQDIDLAAFETWAKGLIELCNSTGARFDAIEFFSQVNWNAFIGDLPLVNGGKIIDDTTATDDADLVSFVAALNRVGQMASTWRTLSDALAAWPILSVAPSVVDFRDASNVNYLLANKGVLVRPATVLEILAGDHALQSTNWLSYFDAIGAAFYPAATDAAPATIAAEIADHFGPLAGQALPLFLTELAHPRASFADEAARLAQYEATLDALGDFSRNTHRIQAATLFAWSQEASSSYYLWTDAGGPEPAAACFASAPHGDRLPEEVATPYAADELDAVHFCQARDRMFFAHPGHPPQMLTRYAANEWTWEPFPVSSHPFADPNGDRTFTLSPNGQAGAGILVEASKDCFKPGMVGSRLEISHRRDNSAVEIAITANGESPSIRPEGVVTFRTAGTWAASVLVEQSYDNGATWELVTPFRANKDLNHDATFTIEDKSLLRLRVADFVECEENPTPYAYLTSEDPYHSGTAIITEYLSPRQVYVEAEAPFYKANSPTPYWRLAAWSEANGWPQAIAFHEGRLWFAGTEAQPTSYWASGSASFYDFAGGIYDDNSIAGTLATPRGDRIQWLFDWRGRLFAGTGAQEWTIGSQNGGHVTPTNISHKSETAYGSAPLQPLLAGDTLLFLQQQGQTLRSLSYDFQRDAYSAEEISGAGEHLLLDGVRCTAHSRQPENVAWFVTPPGRLLAFTLERASGVTAWSRHTTAGQFLSVSAHSAATTEQVWAAVRREINGAPVTYIERMEPNTARLARLGTTARCLFADAGTITAPINGSLRHLEHLEGATIAGTADGATLPQMQVTAGHAKLPSWVSPSAVVCVGLPFAPKVQSLPLQALLRTGSTFGKIAAISQATAYVFNTRGFSYTTGDPDTGKYWTANWRQPDAPTNEAPPLITGPVPFTVDGSLDPLPTITLAQFDPQPFHLLNLSLEWDPIEK